MTEDLEAKIGGDRLMEEFIAAAQAANEVTSRIAAIGLWNSKSAEDRLAYVEQHRSSIANRQTQLTQGNLAGYKSKVDRLYAKLSGLVLKRDQDQPPTPDQLIGALTLPERLHYRALRTADAVTHLVGRQTSLAKNYVEGMRKTITFRRIDAIVKEYDASIDENAAELAKARAKEAALEHQKNERYDTLLKLSDEFENIERYVVATKQQLDIERERHKQRSDGKSVSRDISACVIKDLEPTQKRYDEIAGQIKRHHVLLQHVKRNHASMRMAAHVLDQLDTRLRFDRDFLKDFRDNHTDVIDIDIPLRGLQLIQEYGGFAQGITAFNNGQDDANFDLLKMNIAPGAAITADHAKSEELANQLEHINGEVRNSVREIIDRTRREVFGG